MSRSAKFKRRSEGEGSKCLAVGVSESVCVSGRKKESRTHSTHDQQTTSAFLLLINSDILPIGSGNLITWMQRELQNSVGK